MTTSSYWLKSGFFSLIEKFSVQVFGLGSAMILFRMLSTEDMGVWVIFLMLTSILEVARIGLLANALVKFLVNKEGEDYRRISTASLLLNVGVTVLIGLFLWGAGPWLGREYSMAMLPELLLVYVLTAFLMVPFFQANYMQQANLDFKGVFWSNFARQGVIFAIILYLFLLGNPITLYQLVWVQLAATVIGAITAMWNARLYLRFSTTLDFSFLSQLFQFGKYVFGTNIASMLTKNADKLLLGTVPGIGPAMVALYESAIKITNLMDVPIISMASILYPQSARRAESETKWLYEKSVGSILALLLPIFLVILLIPELFIYILAGAKYLEASSLLRITILFGFFLPFAILFGTILDATGRPHINFIFTFLNLFVYIGINYMFIHLYGIYGAAWGTLLSYAITFIGMQWYLHRTFGVTILGVCQQILPFYRQVGQGIVQRWRAYKSND